MSKPETPRQNPKAEPGSLQRLVRQSNVHELKNLRPNSTQSQRRPALPLRQKCNRATHEYKSAPSCGTSPTVHRRKRRKQRGKLSLRSLRLLLFKTSEHINSYGPSAKLTDDEERAKDARIGTLV